jgi:hypothetical protein
MAGGRKQGEFLIAGKTLKNRFCLGLCHPCIFGALQEQDRTSHVPRVLDGVVAKCVKTLLHSSPKDQQMGRRKGRQPHRGKSVRGSRKQTVERALDDNGIRSNAVDGNHPQDGRTPHRLAVQDKLAVRKLPPHVFDGLDKVVGFADADRRVASPRPTAPVEIEQKGRVAHPMNGSRFEQQARFASALPVGEEDRPFGLLTGNVPGLQLVSFRSPKPVSLKCKPDALGIDRILRAQQANAQK